MKVLVVGGGGREHALFWKIAQSPRVKKIFCAPGNAGISKLAERVPIGAEDIAALADFAQKEQIDLTVVGPEAPLVAGIVDEFEKRNLMIFGPTAKAALLEGSKCFAKEVMKSAGIPTAVSHVLTDFEQAIKLVQEKNMQRAAVKADGLAAGKGVFICRSRDEILLALKKIMQNNLFGNAGKKVLVEELLEGEEASIFAFCDGNDYKLMVSSQDHKRVFDNDRGPNTGGMGAYSPAPIVTPAVQKTVEEKVIVPLLREMKRRGTPYKGILYVGLMFVQNELFVLEFNARFGDPEAQVIIPRLESDLVAIMLACCRGTLSEQELQWKPHAATCVVMASGGYPAHYEKGKPILGLEAAAENNECIVFHAGTKKSNGQILTNGGRVLGVTALGDDIKSSIANAYRAVSKISFEGMHFRRDIGKRALDRLP